MTDGSRPTHGDGRKEHGDTIVEGLNALQAAAERVVG
jgi:hypothetical protein